MDFFRIGHRFSLLLQSAGIISLLAGLFHAGDFFSYVALTLFCTLLIIAVYHHFNRSTTENNIESPVAATTAENATAVTPAASIDAALDNSFRILPILTEQLRAVIEQTDESANGLSAAFIGISRQAKKQLLSVQELLDHLTDKSTNTHSIADTQGSLHEIHSNFTTLITFFDALLQRFAGVAASLSKINDIAEHINKIGHTTDILAINAAIEANGAGISGAGFKVIATEIKGLAKDSNEAITEITDLISDLTENVATMQLEMEKVRTDARKINTSTDRLFGETTESLKSLLDETALKVNEISSDAAGLSKDIGRAVVSIQFQDITRQRIEHVIEPLQTLGSKVRTVIHRVLEDRGAAHDATMDSPELLMQSYTMESEREVLEKITSTRREEVF